MDLQMECRRSQFTIVVAEITQLRKWIYKMESLERTDLSEMGHCVR